MIMAGTDQPSRGLFGSLAGMFDTLLATVQNRLELFAVELQEEKCRLIEALVWAAAVIFLAIMAVTMLTLTVAFLAGMLFGDAALLWVLAGFTLLYATVACGAYRALKQRLCNRPLPFAETIAELKKDRECLRPRK